jgi:hypothetical protein
VYPRCGVFDKEAFFDKERCAGLDVHKKSVFACRICLEPNGSKHMELRTFGTVTSELLKLLDWLRENQITHVAIEATGYLGGRSGQFSSAWLEPASTRLGHCLQNHWTFVATSLPEVFPTTASPHHDPASCNELQPFMPACADM